MRIPLDRVEENFYVLKIADVKSIFADAKSILQLSRRQKNADVKNSELERLDTTYHIQFH